MASKQRFLSRRRSRLPSPAKQCLHSPSEPTPSPHRMLSPTQRRPTPNSSSRAGLPPSWIEWFSVVQPRLCHRNPLSCAFSAVDLTSNKETLFSRVLSCQELSFRFESSDLV